MELYFGQANLVEVIHVTFPTFLYLNAFLAGFLLHSLLEYQGPSSYFDNYAASDLGGCLLTIITRAFGDVDNQFRCRLPGRHGRGDDDVIHQGP